MSFGDIKYKNLDVKVKVNFTISTSHYKLYFNIRNTSRSNNAFYDGKIASLSMIFDDGNNASRF